MRETCHDLSVLCITRGEDCVLPLLRRLIEDARKIGAEMVLAVDSGDALGEESAFQWRTSLVDKIGVRPNKTVGLRSRGYIESVLDEAIDATTRRYVLRIDDDESLSPATVAWLIHGGYRLAPHWKFSRAHLDPTPETFTTIAPLWPDHQTRLSLRELAGGRRYVHSGSPHGGGELAPCVIQHHKTLVKTPEQRGEIVSRYERVQRGAGRNFVAFSLPEDIPGWDKRLIHDTSVADELARDTAMPMIVGMAVMRAFEVGMHQHRGEIEPFARWLAERAPRNILEIGALKGGTATLFHGLCTGRVVSVDLPGGRFGGADFGLDYEACVERNIRLKDELPQYFGVLGDSHQEQTREEVRCMLRGETVDLLFIDGDHTYEGVRQDLEMYLPLVSTGGAVAFHDILTTEIHRAAGCEVDKLWSRIGSDPEWHGRWQARHVFSVGGPWGGIGAAVCL